MKIQTIFGVATVAVVACLLFTFVAQIDDSDKGDEFLGDWTVTNFVNAGFDGDEPFYVEKTYQMDASISRIDDHFFELTMPEHSMVCVLNGDMLVTSNGINDCPLATIHVHGDRMVLTSVVSGDWLGLTMLYLERPGSTAAADLSAASPADSWPEVGESWDAIKALKFEEYTVENILKNGYKIKVLEKHHNVVFFENTCDSEGTRYLFTATPIGDGRWISITHLNDGSVLQDMVYVSDGVIRTASADYISFNEATWYIAYGDKTKDKDLSLDVAQMKFTGKESAKLVDGAGNILKEYENDIELTVFSQNDHMLLIATSYSGGDFKGNATWEVLAENESYGLSLTVQASFFIDDDDYLGYYYGTLSKDMNTIKVSGIAVGPDGNYVVVTQEYNVGKKINLT